LIKWSQQIDHCAPVLGPGREPNGLRISEKCVVVTLRMGPHGFEDIWKDVNCERNNFHYICKASIVAVEQGKILTTCLSNLL